MTSRQRFEAAYAAWQATPIAPVDASSSLWDLSNTLAHTQDDIAPILTAYYDRSEVLPPPIADQRWYDVPNFHLTRSIRSLRQLVQGRRQQVATRELLTRAETLKEAWDAYRATTKI